MRGRGGERGKGEERRRTRNGNRKRKRKRRGARGRRQWQAVAGTAVVMVTGAHRPETLSAHDKETTNQAPASQRTAFVASGK